MTAISWGAKVEREFVLAVVELANHLGCYAGELMACMAFETGGSFDPAKHNPASSATGLIQFMRDTALGLGTTVEDLARMTRLEQLEKVAEYFEPYRGRLHTLADVYMAILWPAAVGLADDAEIFPEGSRAYLANRGLDIDHNGAVTKAEAAGFVARAYAEGLRVGNVLELELEETQPAAPIEDRSTTVSTSTQPEGNKMPAILAAILPQIFALFSGRAQAAIGKVTGASPEVSGQFLQSMAAQLGQVAGIPIVDDASAVQAVAKITAAKDPAQIKALEDHALDYLDKISPLLRMIGDLEHQARLDTIAEGDAAAARVKFYPKGLSTMIAKQAFTLADVVVLFLAGAALAEAIRVGAVSAAMMGMIGTIAGLVVRDFSTVVRAIFGGSSESEAAEVGAETVRTANRIKSPGA